jgi:hypothetical protein
MSPFDLAGDGVNFPRSQMIGPITHEPIGSALDFTGLFCGRVGSRIGTLPDCAEGNPIPPPKFGH